jgi:hypothetical protein
MDAIQRTMLRLQAKHDQLWEKVREISFELILIDALLEDDECLCALDGFSVDGEVLDLQQLKDCLKIAIGLLVNELAIRDLQVKEADDEYEQDEELERWVAKRETKSGDLE